MLAWLKKRFNKWVERQLKKENERLQAESRRLQAENRRLSAEYQEATGETHIELTPKERERLIAVRSKVDPEWLKKHDAETGDVFGLRRDGLPPK